MSADTAHAAHTGEHAAAHHDAHSEGGHGSVKSYVTGFVLSVILTVIPFWLVMGKVLDSNLITALVILALGAVQMVVHLIYFLHMNTRSEHGWTFMALIFTVTLVVIMLAGSVWVMHHLNTNMMPTQGHDMLSHGAPNSPTQGQPPGKPVLSQPGQHQQPASGQPPAAQPHAH